MSGPVNVDRRTVLRTTGATFLSGLAVASVSGSAGADHCPDPDSDEDYWDCDNPSDEYEYYKRPYGDIVEGEVSLMVGNKAVRYDYCNGCVTYYFDIVGIHEAADKRDDGENEPYLDSFGFRWNTSSTVTPDPQPESSDNIQSGITHPDEDASPEGDDEEAWWALGDVLVAGGTVLYPQLAVPAFLYTVARASDIGENIDDEVRFDPYGNIESGGFAYYNMRFQIDENKCGSVEIEGFAENKHGGHPRTTTKKFYLDRHKGCGGVQ
jgi:hypothetical protein